MNVLKANRKLVYATLVIALFLIYPANFANPPVFAAGDRPTIQWEPSKTEVSVFKGAGRTIDVSFTSSQGIEGVNLFAAPEIRPYVRVIDQSFSDQINLGERNSLALLVSIPSNVSSTTFEGTLHIRQGNRTVAKPLPIIIHVLDPAPAVNKLEQYLLDQFGTTEPPVGSDINPPQEIIDELSAGSNLPLIFKSGSLNFVGYLPPEDGALKTSILNLVNLLKERDLDTAPLIDALNSTVYTKDDPQKTVIEYGADAITFDVVPFSKLFSPLKGVDTDGNNGFDTFVLITDLSPHTILRLSDIENIKNSSFFEDNLILNQSARITLHELVHVVNDTSRCNDLEWLAKDPEEFYTLYLESLFTHIISSDFPGINFSYNQVKDIISPNLNCLEILNLIPPQAVSLNNPVTIEPDSVELSWSKNSDSDFQFYRIYRSNSPNVGFGSALVTEIDDQNQVSFTDTDLSPDATYYYKVFVFDKTGLSNGSNEMVVNLSPGGMVLFEQADYSSSYLWSGTLSNKALLNPVSGSARQLHLKVKPNAVAADTLSHIGLAGIFKNDVLTLFYYSGAEPTGIAISYADQSFYCFSPAQANTWVDVILTFPVNYSGTFTSGDIYRPFLAALSNSPNYNPYRIHSPCTGNALTGEGNHNQMEIKTDGSGNLYHQIGNNL